MPVTPDSTPPAAGRILLADDTPITTRLITDYLVAKGFSVSVAEDGMQALTAVQAAPPDVLLLDIQMPMLDGFAVMQAIRAHEDPRVRNVRIIALTAMAMRGDAERCLAMGANAYCAKPVRLRDLTQVIIAELEVARSTGEAPVVARPLTT